MSNLLTGWDGGAGEDGLALLMKALEAGSGADAGSFTGGRALIPESLDRTLVNILWNQDDAKLFKKLKRNTISGPVHQWTDRDDVGNSDGAWVQEGAESFEKNSNFTRRFVEAKYLQTRRQITLQMMSSNAIEQAEAIEKNAGTLWLIQNIEKALFHGNASIIGEQFTGIEYFDGINTIDLRGSDLINNSQGEEAWSQASRIIYENHGMATDAFMSTTIAEDIQKLLRDRLRVPTNGASAMDGASGGYVYTKYPTHFGDIMLEADKFIRRNNETPQPSTLTALRPDQPTVVAAAVTAANTNENSQFVAASAGTYYYTVVAFNKYGESVQSATVNATVAAGGSITLTITDGATAGTGYRVFRSRIDANASQRTDLRFMVEVSRSAGNVITDLNNDLPNTSPMFVLNLNPTPGAGNAIEWEQWLPMMKFQLYPTASAVNPFLMLLYGALGVKKPQHIVRVKNISYSRDNWYN